MPEARVQAACAHPLQGHSKTIPIAEQAADLAIDDSVRILDLESNADALHPSDTH